MSGYSKAWTTIIPHGFAIAVAAVWVLLTCTTQSAAQSLLLTGTNPASTAQTIIENVQDWQVTCEKAENEDPACEMAAVASTNLQNGQTIGLRLTQLRATHGGKALFAVETPLDLLLSKGIEIRIDNGPLMRLAFRSCHRDGCLAPFEMNRKLAQKFRKGSEINMRVFDLKGDPMDVRLSLHGFTAAAEMTGI